MSSNNSGALNSNGMSYSKRSFAITDSLLSPLATKSDYTLIAQSNMASFVDSLVAPLSVINALIIAVGLREKEKISSIFTGLEDIWEEYKVYSFKNDTLF